jgi:AcrR family transcriptional regulator
MYQMVRSAVTSSQPRPAPGRDQARDRLLAATVDQAKQGGIADLSLRELAAAIGTSHRMLLYHFGSREGLLTAVARAVEDAERADMLSQGTTVADARRVWAHLSAPELWPLERLFFEMYVLALRGRPGTEGFLDSVVPDWITGLAAAMTEAGVDAGAARVHARLGLAVARGLLLDLLATGDRDGVNAAHELFLGRYDEPQ